MTKAFAKAKKMLQEQYGNQYKIADHYLQKLKEWPEVKAEDGTALKQFAVFLTTCNNLMNEYTSLCQLNSMRDIREAVLKLPWNLRVQFRTKANELMLKNKTVNFNTLVQFVNKQAQAQNLPCLGDLQTKKQTDKKSTYTPKTRSFATNSDEGIAKGSSSTTSSFKQDKECPCCKKMNHTLDACIFFRKKPYEEREAFIKKHKLCFSCIAYSNHMSKDCKRKLTCKTCNKQHPTSLHRDYEQKGDEKEAKTKSESGKKPELEDKTASKNLRIKSTTNKTACPAIPVILKAENGNEVTTYMAIDTYSTSNYMDNKLLSKLNVTGMQKTLSLTTIENQSVEISTTVVENIEILSLDRRSSATVKKIYAKKNWTFTSEDSPQEKDAEAFPRIPFQYLSDANIGVLIGMSEPAIIKPEQIYETTKNGPYASKHLHGWALNGPVKGNNTTNPCLRTTKKETDQLTEKFNAVFASDFKDDEETTNGTYSEKEQKWLKNIERQTVKTEDNKLEIKLPIKEDQLPLQDNLYQATKRYESLQKKLTNDNNLLEDYETCMHQLIKNGHAEPVPPEETSDTSGKVWYLTHHGVRHKTKGKLRVVFDGSLKYKQMCLNDILQAGPDLTSSSVGVLLRFRTEKVGLTADIKHMFYCVKVPTEDRNYLRFLWHDQNETITANPKPYRLTVHVFGATSSPAVANFALRKCAEETENEAVKKTIQQSFYVDDLLTSCPDEEAAITIANETSQALKNNGFTLTKFASNKREVIEAIPEELRAHPENVHLTDNLPTERALGVLWKPETDTIGYEVKLPENQSTKRGILSTLHSLYDPLFLASPACIKAKKIFQTACQSKLGWDDPLPSELNEAWNKWKTDIKNLNKFEIPRCYRTGIKNCKDQQLHIFTDGSLTAYGAVAYLRTSDEDNTVTTSIMAAKARLTPIDRNSLKTVPRIELNAAKIGVELYEKIRKETKNVIKPERTVFWTDSTATLAYIKNNEVSFKPFVENRVHYIRSKTEANSWRHTPGEQNPADLISRGTNNIEQFASNKQWTEGPAFLKKPPSEWPSNPVQNLPNSDEEIRKKTINLSTTEEEKETCLQKLINSTSSFYKAKKNVAILAKFKTFLQKKPVNTAITVTDLKEAEISIIKEMQQNSMRPTYQTLKRGNQISKKNQLAKLSPFIDEDDIIRVGGRLENAAIPYDEKHPIILPANEHGTILIVRNKHKELGHMGLEYMKGALRNKYHILKGNKLIRSVLKTCVTCKKNHGKPAEQLMANLPKHRITGNQPPFTNTATDLFGPFFVTKGRGKAQEKRYGVVFSCLATRATHIEIVSSLDTDSYINALRRFISRRGTPQSIYSDNGTNLVKANKELKTSIQEWNKNKLQEWSKQQNIDWTFQTPLASHHGGVHERVIRTVRQVFQAILLEYQIKAKLTDETLSTLFCEVENILNHRPLTAIQSDDTSTHITPNSLLRLQTNADYPPGIFTSQDETNVKRWRQAQYLADQWWNTWRKKYIHQLQQRQKWLTKKKSLQKGDIVLIADAHEARNHWQTGVIINTKDDPHGNVRTATIKTNNGEIKRPITKLVPILLCE